LLKEIQGDASRFAHFAHIRFCSLAVLGELSPQHLC